ncbi:hypothetical protein LTR09_007649 [Extremus antarcticus]|uniref:Uncharacterized protein n=1 Tax=Extremus antarcticus TaxID=702011 RepID=A0AAJ0DC67_9PEZI|nr:hypothetical protein LTR09_007649 [Extremus antarcticus]
MLAMLLSTPNCPDPNDRLQTPPNHDIPYESCIGCITQAELMLYYNSALIDPGEQGIFRGNAGCHFLGRLCPGCQDNEIAEYHKRLCEDDRYASGNPATRVLVQEKAASTCICQAKPKRNPCYGHRHHVLTAIQAKSAFNANWL